MNSCSEYVSSGHSDKVADLIASYLLDEYIKHDPKTRFALEVQLKDHICNLAGEVTSTWKPETSELAFHVKEAIRKVGYTSEYAAKWPKDATLNADHVLVNNFIGQQSPNIAQGVDREGWGDQGIFCGMATNNGRTADYGYMPRDRYFSHEIGRRLYNAALNGEAQIGLDIKVLVSLTDGLNAEQIIVAAPMLPENEEEGKQFITTVVNDVLQEHHHTCDELLINGTGSYVIHSSVGDAGVVGRKLAVDFYGLNCPIGGGCVDAETEYLAPDGWHKISAYKGGEVAQVDESLKVSFVKPERFIKTFHNDVYKIETSHTLSMVLSGNHNVFYRTSKGHFRKKSCEELIADSQRSARGSHAEIPRCFTYAFDGKTNYDNEFFARLLIAHCADGNVMKKGRFNGTLPQCRIRVKKERKIQLLRSYFPRSGLTWEERKYSDGYTYFYYFLENPSKRLCEHFSSPSLRMAKLLAEEVFKWDGDEKRREYRTTIKEDADFVQFVLSGFYGDSYSINTHIWNKGDKTQMYQVRQTQVRYSTPFRKIAGNTMQKVAPQNMYCFTVPTGLLLLRRRNYIFVTGNSPWGKDATKADVTLNIAARYFALKELLENPERVTVYCKIACCIGQSKCLVAYSDENHKVFKQEQRDIVPSDIINKFGLDGTVSESMFFTLCQQDLFSYVDFLAKYGRGGVGYEAVIASSMWANAR